jgi:hypothetical protein
LIQGLIILFFVTIFTLLLGYKWISEKSHAVFWVSLLLYFDPGGVFAGYQDGNIFWRIKYYDVLFLIMMFAWYYSGIAVNQLPLYKEEMKKTKVFLVLVSLFFLLITGYIVPNIYGFEDFPFFLQKNRQYFYTIPLLISVFQFSCRSVDLFYKYLQVISIVVLGAYFITLLSGIELLPVLSWSRFGENDRLSLISYGLVHWVLPMGLIALSLNRKIEIPQKNLLILVMSMMLITIILTLTRREFIRVIFMLAFIPYMSSRVSKTPLISRYHPYLVPGFFIVILIIALFPAYLGFSSLLLGDIYALLFQDADSASMKDYRVSGGGDLLIVKNIINEHLLLGIGYYPAPWEKVLDMKNAGNSLGFALDASSEVPVYGAMMRLGLIGLIIPSLFYIFLLNHILKAWRFIRNYYTQIRKYPRELLILLTILYFFIAQFTVDLFSLFGDFYHPPGMAMLGIMLALLWGMLARLKSKVITNQARSVGASNASNPAKYV